MNKMYNLNVSNLGNINSNEKNKKSVKLQKFTRSSKEFKELMKIKIKALNIEKEKQLIRQSKRHDIKYGIKKNSANFKKYKIKLQHEKAIEKEINRIELQSKIYIKHGSPTLHISRSNDNPIKVGCAPTLNFRRLQMIKNKNNWRN